MLHDFLVANRSDIIDRCREKVLKRRAPRATPAELEHGVALFLDQFTRMLPGGPEAADANVQALELHASKAEMQIAIGAAKHGGELLLNDFTIEQVVHDYGDLCQSITELASEQAFPLTAREFGVLNIRLDNAIAGAVAEYTRQHDAFKADVAMAANERLGLLGHEMRNLLNTTILAISAIKRGSVGFSGATAAALDRSLISMGGLIDRTLAEVRLEEGATSLREVIEIGPFIADVQIAAALEASHKGCELNIELVDQAIFVEGDRHILASAVANLLKNAFAFARTDCNITLRAYAKDGRVSIEVQDDGGSIPEALLEELSLPLVRDNASHRGRASGISISRKGVEASGGTLLARNIEQKGCVFAIRLPQKMWPG
jgi:signal transduction histidine kinase